MKSSLFIILALFLISKSFGQINPDINKYTIKGKIYDSSTKQIITNVTIRVVDKKYACDSDAVGDFELKLPLEYSRKKFQISFSCVACEAEFVEVKNNDTTLKKRSQFL
jgi:hypothetical protein